MSKLTIDMVHDSIQAYVQKDEELARSVMTRDDLVDALFMQIKDDLIGLVHKNVDNGSQAMDLLMIAKYLERIGDHAENIAEWVLFSLTGMHKNRQVL
jgi:phosphate transport system protein